jgi:crotonobetaine/carnitine-CoA ligase
MTEYHKMPEKTLETCCNLWFHTGDYAKKNEDLYFYFMFVKKMSYAVEAKKSLPLRWKRS